MGSIKNKNIKRARRRSASKIFTALFLALVLFGGLAYFKYFKNNPTSVSQEEQKSAEQADVDQAKQKAEEESQSEPLKDSGGDDNTTPTTIPSSASLGSPSFSQADHMINSSVQVSGATSGNCKFTFVDADGKPVVKSVALSGSTCSVSISEAEFTLLGTWKLTVEFGNKSVSRDVNIS